MPFQALALFTLLNIFNYLDRYLVAANLPQIIQDFNITQEEGGRLVSAFVFGYFLFSPIFGYLGDRISRPKLMALGAVLWGLATVATGLAPTYGTFLFARILVGVGEASFGTIIPGYLKDKISDPIRLNAVFSIFFAAIPVGSALGYVVSGFVVEHYPWQYSFFIGGVPAILLGAALIMFGEARSTQPSAQSFKSQLAELGRHSIIWLALSGYVLNTFALTGVATFVTKYGVEIGFSLDEISKIFGLILVFTGFAGTFLGGRLCNHLCKGKPDPVPTMFRFIAIAALLGTPFAFLGFASGDHTLFLIGCVLAQLCIFSGTAPVNSIIVLSCPKHLVTFTQGMTIFAINLGGSLLSPIVVGAIADKWNLRYGLWFASFMLFLSGVVWLFGAMRQKVSLGVPPSAEKSNAKR